MMTALAFLLSYVETLIPINLGVPGVKLGLANLASIVSLYLLGAACGSGDCIGAYRVGRIYVWKPVDDAV
ncbi:MAG: Gx transporter family protein [Clostridium fessum]